MTCIGDERNFSYLPSIQDNSLSDRVAYSVFKKKGIKYTKYSFLNRGSDERQYNSPRVNIPVGSIMRSKYQTYPEYHTSLDDLINVVTPKGLQGGFDAIRRALVAIENNIYPQVKVLCEPQLGRRGLYETLSRTNSSNSSSVTVDLISWSDGQHSLLEIAEKIDAPIWELYDVLETLSLHNLIEKHCHQVKPN